MGLNRNVFLASQLYWLDRESCSGPVILELNDLVAFQNKHLDQRLLTKHNAPELVLLRAVPNFDQIVSFSCVWWNDLDAAEMHQIGETVSD